MATAQATVRPRLRFRPNRLPSLTSSNTSLTRRVPRRPSTGRTLPLSLAGARARTRTSRPFTTRSHSQAGPSASGKSPGRRRLLLPRQVPLALALSTRSLASLPPPSLGAQTSRRRASRRRLPRRQGLFLGVCLRGHLKRRSRGHPPSGPGFHPPCYGLRRAEAGVASPRTRGTRGLPHPVAPLRHR